MSLNGRRVVVTGATGIAAEGASRLLDEGAEVFVISIDESECSQLGESLGISWCSADLSDDSAAENAFAEAAKSLGGIDGLFAVAGGSGRSEGDGPLHEIPLGGWESTLRLNLTTTFLSVRETIRNMLNGGKGGSIVMVSSVLASSPSPGLFSTHAYAAAKGAQISLTAALAAHYAPDRIRVNAIAPGLVRTPMSERAFNDPTTFQYAANKQPLASGFLEPSDISRAAVYLLGDGSANVTGQVIAIDGGWSVTEASR